VDPITLQNLASPDTDPSAAVEQKEAVAEALQIVLQVTSPSERAAFLLHDIFGLRHAEVATVLQRSESALRQIVHRARVRARVRGPRFSVSSKAHGRSVQRPKITMTSPQNTDRPVTTAPRCPGPWRTKVTLPRGSDTMIISFQLLSVRP
jgi:hypothetical protein